MKFAVSAALLALLLQLTACSTTRYYYQAARGHLALLASADPVEEVIPQAAPEVAAALELVQRVRTFAADELGLSFNDSYTTYVDLERDYVVQNLYVAPEFSTELHVWCYWVIGCANYRGFFDAGMLAQQRDDFAQRGFDTHVAPVTAYSTLGWFTDPVLSSFVGLPEYRLVGLVLHELAHQQLYVEGDTFFNESFAMAVEHAGLARFYEGPARLELAEYRRYLAGVDAFTDLAIRTRAALDALYRQRIPAKSMRARKARLLAGAAAEYAALTGREGAVFNNASLGAVAAYNRYVAAFDAMLADSGGDLPAFYRHAQRLGELEAQARTACLESWLQARSGTTTAIPAPCAGAPARQVAAPRAWAYTFFSAPSEVAPP